MCVCLWDKKYFDITVDNEIAGPADITLILDFVHVLPSLFPLPHSLLFKDLVSLVLKIPTYSFLWLRHVSAASCSSFNISSLFQDHIQEVLNKWQSIDDEIWAKIIVLERNR